jgi:hypothetical protein
MPSLSKDVTQLLRDWRQGDQAALNQLMPVVYEELRKLGASWLRRERPGHTLQPTALPTRNSSLTFTGSLPSALISPLMNRIKESK